MKHETFKQVAIGEAFETIEGSILPSLTMLIEQASVAQPGMDSEATAQELRALARQLESLTALFENGMPAPQAPAPNPFSTDE
ncbi:MAG TPA: hypothetical protein VGB54_02735 [Allosphingosinicella sp.]